MGPGTEEDGTPLTQETDMELVKAARAGDVESLGRLYERHFQSMAWVAYAVLFDREQAQDVAQETFAVACRKLIDLERPERFAPWLTRICRNLAIDALRRRRGEDLSLDDIDEPAQPVAADAGEPLRQAVGRLPQMYREIVVLRYFDEMSYEELRRVLGISLHAVKGRLFRAKQRLREQLNGSLEDRGD